MTQASDDEVTTGGELNHTEESVPLPVPGVAGQGNVMGIMEEDNNEDTTFPEPEVEED